MNNNNNNASSSISSVGTLPSAITVAVTALSGLELFIHPAGVLLSTFSFSLLFHSKLLHDNLKSILLSQSAAILVVSANCQKIKFIILKIFYMPNKLCKMAF
jgi:hypothetical protein